MRISVCLVALLSVVLLSCEIKAEKPPSSTEQLLKESTNVVTGTVKAVYKRTEKKESWEYTHFIAEIRVKEPEKGAGIAADSLIYVRYWQKQWKGKGLPPADTSGHYPIPGKNDVVRVYLARNSYDGFTDENEDGGFNVIGTNGFEQLPSKTGK